MAQEQIACHPAPPESHGPRRTTKNTQKSTPSKSFQHPVRPNERLRPTRNRLPSRARGRHIDQPGKTWADSARKLHAAGMIDTAARDAIVRLHCFGQLIGNTDMHFGNVSFFLSDDRPLPLCPVYDRLPIRFNPSGSGEIRHTQLTRKLPKPENESAWLAMYPAALDYWRKIAQSAEISSDFHEIARRAISALRIRSLAGT